MKTKAAAILLAVLSTLASAAAQSTPGPRFLPAPSAEQCAPAAAKAGTAAQWLDRAAARIIPAATAGRVLRFRTTDQQADWIESDRTYEPFIPVGRFWTNWLDLSTNAVAHQSVGRPLALTQYPEQLDLGARGSFAGQDTTLKAANFLRASGEVTRRLNPWVVLEEWRAHAVDVHVAQRCLYREYWRTVLTRGDERLYLTESDAIPVKLDRIEPHFLWGQLHAEYLWSTWWGVKGGGLYPAASFLQYDGFTFEQVGTVNNLAELIPADSAPRLIVPPTVAPAPNPGSFSLTGAKTDTVRVNDHAFLLVTPAYTEAVILARDTVFLLDATSGDERGRQDSAWIATLFPGHHPVSLVVTDLAWPHIASVRFWVARGATIVSHRMSEDFLRRVVDRRWTLNPDALEKARATAKFRFHPVADSLRLADGALVVHAMRGTLTEGALAVWDPADRFLWAGDYIQRTATSPYYYDVVLNVRALGLHPDKAAAQHVGLMDWSTVERRVPAGVQP